MAARDDRESKARRRVARTLVATYHEAELEGLAEHVAEAIERYRVDELDVHDVDEVIHPVPQGNAGAVEVLLSRRLGRMCRDGRRDT